MGSKVQQRFKDLLNKSPPILFPATRRVRDYANTSLYLKFYVLILILFGFFWFFKLTYAVSPWRAKLGNTSLIKTRSIHSIETPMHSFQEHSGAELYCFHMRSIWSKGVLHSDLKHDGLWCPLLHRKYTSALLDKEQKQNLFLSVLSCSTSHLKCWLSSWPILPEEWNTSATRTSSTETSLPATACKHNLCFCILLFHFLWVFSFALSLSFFFHPTYNGWRRSR